MGEEEKMSKNNRNKKYNNASKQGKSSTFGKLMISVMVLGIVLLIFINYALPMLKESASKVVADKTVDLITENAEKIAEGNPEIKQFLENMSEEDKETVSEIISEHTDAETVSEVIGYVNSGDKESLIEYATQNLSPEEISTLMELYGKYSEY